MPVYIQNRRRLRRKRFYRRLKAAVIIGVVLIFIICCALLLLGARNENDIQNESDTAVEPSSVQDSIESLDWVTQDLLTVNDYSRPGITLIDVNAVVIHYVGNPGTTAEQNRNYYNGLAETEATYASSNFLIGLDGEILECVPVDEIAYCSNWRNDDTISIECCHPDETGAFTEDTYNSLVKLTAWLCTEFQLDSSDLLRHYDITGKECPLYFVTNEEAWEIFKSDVQAAIDNI